MLHVTLFRPPLLRHCPYSATQKLWKWKSWGTRIAPTLIDFLGFNLISDPVGKLCRDKTFCDILLRVARSRAPGADFQKCSVINVVCPPVDRSHERKWRHPSNAIRNYAVTVRNIVSDSNIVLCRRVWWRWWEIKKGSIERKLMIWEELDANPLGPN